MLHHMLRAAAGNRVSYALSFDGADDYVSIPNDASLNIISDIEVFGNVRIKSYQAGNCAVYTNGTSAWSAMLIIDDGYPTFSCVQTDPIVRINAVSSERLNLDELYTVKGVREGTSIKIYVNGVERGSNSINTEPLRDPFGNEKRIGQGPDDAYLNAVMYGIKINNGVAADWPINEGSGTTIYDDAGTNDGTIYGATWVEL